MSKNNKKTIKKVVARRNSKHDGHKKRWLIMKELGMKEGEYEEFIRGMYRDGMSGLEISEYLLRETGIEMSGRSIQRVVAKYGESRDAGDAFRNAIDRGRVEWQLEMDEERREGARHQLCRKLRLKIIERDGMKCVICGAKELLQVDYVVARMNGGKDVESNLRTLCIDCNIGKALLHAENRQVGGFKSGEVGSIQ